MREVDAGGKQVSERNGRVDLDDPDHQTMIATLPVALASGTYSVKWHALLTDGDASDGTLHFVVGAASAASEATKVLAPTAPTASAVATSQPTLVAADGADSTPAAEVRTQASAKLPGAGEQSRRSPGLWVAGLAAVALAAGLAIIWRRGRQAT